MFSKIATISRTRSQFSNGSFVQQIGNGSTSRSTLAQQRQSVFGNPSIQSLNPSCRQFCDKASEVVTPVKGKTTDGAEQIQKVASKATDQHFNSRPATNFDKRLLVYFGKFKTAEEVPELVSVSMLNASRNKFRVYVNIFLAFMTMVGCGTMIYIGHTNSGQGETLADHNMKRHPEHYRKQLKE